MTKLTRRSLLGSAVAAMGSGVAAPASAAPAVTATAASTGGDGLPTPGPVTVTRADPQYDELVVGFNQRFVARPDAIQLVSTPGQVEAAVRSAVRAGRRISVRSGGHCYANFVYNDQTQLIIDLSVLNHLAYDPARNAFCIEAGAQLGEIYEWLYREHGVTLPGGICTTVGLGGHTSGGGFGLLTRQFGMVSDLLEAVEMVVVGAGGRVRTVLATRDPDGPNHDLFWAVTGGGGGTFGIATRFWFRTRGATGSAPQDQLPQPPSEVLISLAQWPWADVSKADFTRVTQNYLKWHLANSAPGSRGTKLASILFGGTGTGVGLLTQVNADQPDLLASWNAALTAGTKLTVPAETTRSVRWFSSTKVVASGSLLYDPTLRSAFKTAFIRGNLSDAQLSGLYDQLNTSTIADLHGIFQLISVGGQMNALSPAETAGVHRDSVAFGEFETFWRQPQSDAVNLAWLRKLYGDTWSATGGYPVSSPQADGAYINNPDLDITDPTWNTSGVPWSTIYWGENYAPLQKIKARWDPTNFFRHAQSVRLPG